MPWQDVWYACACTTGGSKIDGRSDADAQKYLISWASPQDGGLRGCTVSPGKDQLPTLVRVRPCAACPEFYSVGQEYVRDSTDNADCKELSYEPPPPLKAESTGRASVLDLCGF